MKAKLLLVTLFCLLNSLNGLENDIIKFEIGGRTDKSDISTLYRRSISGETLGDDTESGDGSGGDDNSDDYSGSGSGSGDVDTNSILPTKGSTTEMLVVINDGTSTKSTTTQGNEIVVETRKDPFDVTVQSDMQRDENNPKGEKSTQKKAGVNFTVGIIIGVVLGAALAIAVIAFLVYRLRKKDEGSYSLDEQSSAFIKDEKSNQGKEYFA